MFIFTGRKNTGWYNLIQRIQALCCRIIVISSSTIERSMMFGYKGKINSYVL